MAYEPVFDYDRGEENGTRSRARKLHEDCWCAMCFLAGVVVATAITAVTLVVL